MSNAYSTRCGNAKSLDMTGSQLGATAPWMPHASPRVDRTMPRILIAPRYPFRLNLRWIHTPRSDSNPIGQHGEFVLARSMSSRPS